MKRKKRGTGIKRRERMMEEVKELVKRKNLKIVKEGRIEKTKTMKLKRRRGR